MQKEAISVQNKTTTMKAFVYHGAGKKAWEDKPMPTIKATTDAVVKILKTTICGYSYNTDVVKNCTIQKNRTQKISNPSF